MDRGIKGSGQGFDAKSAGRLGAHGFIPTHNVPEHQRRAAMLKVRVARRSSDRALLQERHARPRCSVSAGSAMSHASVKTTP